MLKKLGKDGQWYPPRSGENNSSWKGGKQKSGNGYIQVMRPGNPRADSRGRMLEHVAIAEDVLGKPLPPDAVVHHVDGVKSHNAKTNLVICQDQLYHLLLHRRQRALEACGDANSLQCRHCKVWDSAENLTVIMKRKNGKPNGVDAQHKACHRQAEAARKATG